MVFHTTSGSIPTDPCDRAFRITYAERIGNSGCAATNLGKFLPILRTAGFADDLEVSDHCVLVTRILSKLIVGKVGFVAFDPVDCFNDRVQKVVQLERVLPKTQIG